MERLASMPKGIEGMYTLIVERLYTRCKGNEEEAVMFQNMLSWMVVAPVPITVSGMQWMLITTPGKDFDPAGIVLPSAELMQERCGSLIELVDADESIGSSDDSIFIKYNSNNFDESDDSSNNSIVDAAEEELTTENDNRQIRFTHRTIKEFLIDRMNTKRKALLSVTLPDTTTATLELALICRMFWNIFSVLYMSCSLTTRSISNSAQF